MFVPPLAPPWSPFALPPRYGPDFEHYNLSCSFKSIDFLNFLIQLLNLPLDLIIYLINQHFYVQILAPPLWPFLSPFAPPVELRGGGYVALPPPWLRA